MTPRPEPTMPASEPGTPNREQCAYCGETRYFDRARDYWRCQSKVGAKDNFERSTGCRQRETAILLEIIADLVQQCAGQDYNPVCLDDARAALKPLPVAG